MKELIAAFDLPFSQKIAEPTGIIPQEIESAPSLAEAGRWIFETPVELCVSADPTPIIRADLEGPGVASIQ
jgi:hypothetical protein